MSQVSCDAIISVLSRHYTKVGVSTVNNLSDLEDLVVLGPDLVFLGMKYVPSNPALGRQDSNKVWLADYLDEHDISYTGSGHRAHQLELDKALAKQCLLYAGLKTSSFMVAKYGGDIRGTDLAFPLFVKPTNRGGGAGIDSDSVVHTPVQLANKIQAIRATLQSDSLIEEYLPGREFSVAILKTKNSTQYTAMPLELIAEPDQYGRRVLSSSVKSSNAEQAIEVTDLALQSKINSLAMAAFHVLGARDYGRIDIRLDKSGTPQFLEANLLPSLIAGYGSFPKSCHINIGLGYEPMILYITRLGLRRNNKSHQGVARFNGLDALDITSRGPIFEPA